MSTRLLIVTTIPLTFDGFLAPYARAAKKRGWTVDLATSPGTIANRDAVDDVLEIAWSRRFSDPRNFSSALWSFRQAIAGREYDIVHMHTPIAAFIARAAFALTRRSKRPRLVYTAHGFHFGVGGVRARHAPIIAAEWLAGRITDKLVVINDTDFTNARRLRIVHPDDVVYHHGIGVDLAWYDRAAIERGKARAAMGIGNDPLFTLVAALHPGKGHAESLRALALLPNRNAHLAFAGDGILESQLRALTTDLDLDDRVHYLGHIGDVRPLIVDSTATLLPSSREGLSRATLESLCLGTPVIGSDIRGIADTVRPDGGVLVPVGDVSALAEAMQSAIDAPLLDDLGRRRVRTRMTDYSTQSVLCEHEALYRSLLGDEAMGAPAAAGQPGLNVSG
jgi:glycosyltransferase involved in cell wall biosynthesis